MKDKNKRKIRIIIKIILVIVWMIVIFRFSSENGEISKNTSQEAFKDIVKPFDSSITEDSSAQTVEDFQPLIRKTAHFVLYTLGGVLIYSLMSELNNKEKEKIKGNKYIIYAIVVGALYASSDELHQYFVPGRSSEIKDVILDTTGIILGVFLCIWIYRLLSKRGNQK